MKCTNCGNHEANCHYTMNVNGHMTEHHLCHECAGEMGIGQEIFGDFEHLFDGMFTGFFPTVSRSPFGVFPLPRMTMPKLEIRLNGCGNGKCETAAAPEREASGADPEMRKKRELNVLRRQMKRAAADENFEEAARLRDRIRSMEGEARA